MKPGDLVKRKDSKSTGLYLGTRLFKNFGTGDDYTCAEVIWFETKAPNGDPVSTVQSNLIEVYNQ